MTPVPSVVRMTSAHSPRLPASEMVSTARRSGIVAEDSVDSRRSGSPHIVEQARRGGPQGCRPVVGLHRDNRIGYSTDELLLLLWSDRIPYECRANERRGKTPESRNREPGYLLGRGSIGPGRVGPPLVPAHHVELGAHEIRRLGAGAVKFPLEPDQRSRHPAHDERGV